MRSWREILCLSVFVASVASVATAQRPRPVSNEPAPKTDSSKTTTATTNTTATATAAATTTAAAPVAPAPQSVRAKYEGGLVGFSKKMTGTLSFDDMNQRLVFRNEANKELLSIPYSAIVSAYPDTQSRTSTTASVIGTVVPFASLIKTKYRYLAMQYRDPDTQTSGTTSFKLDTRELIASMIGAIGNKAGLTQRGDAYIRRKATDTATDDGSAKPE